MYLYIDMHYAINVNYAHTTFLHRQNFSLSFQMGGVEKEGEERKSERGREGDSGEGAKIGQQERESVENMPRCFETYVCLGTWRMIFLQKHKRTDGQTKYRAKHQLLKSHNIEQTIRL